MGVMLNLENNQENSNLLNTSQIALDSITDTVQAEIKSTSDHLSGLLNKAGIEKFSKSQFSYAQRENKEVGIFFIDLNKFKPINDELSHEDGDKAIKLCAKKIKETVRRADILARYGGDEFVVIMLNDKNHDWKNQYNKLETLFDDGITYKSDDGEEYPIGASIGFVIAHDEEIPAAAIKRADTEMYKIKNGQPNANPDLGLESEQPSLTVQQDLDF